MEMLREAIQNGYQKLPHMKQDRDLDPLRHRADFQALFRELEKRDGLK